jgi:hypothetical protein
MNHVGQARSGWPSAERTDLPLLDASGLVAGLSGDQCAVMDRIADAVPVRLADSRAAADRLRLAVAAYLAPLYGLVA